MVEAAITWLEEYQDIRIRLVKLASDRRSIPEPGSPVLSTSEEVDEHLQRLMAK